jgi:uncharacterized membrane protein
VRALALVPVALAVAGVALVGLAVLRGGATAGVLVVVPFVAGSSLLLVLGVLALFGAFLTLPLALPSAEEEPELPAASPASGGGVGGLVVLGPLPIFFGSWRSVSPTVRVAAVLAGAALLVVAALAVLGVFR